VQRANRTIVAPWSKWLGRIRPHAVDAGLAVGVAVTIAISVAREPGARPPDTLAYALGVTIGALVLARRHWPVGVLVASFVTLQVYYFANYPGILPAVPLAVAAYYQPACAVGGDFYDLLELPDGQVALVTGDVTGKGIPAALVMATTHSILRGEAPGLVSPGAVLGRANDRLYPDIPAHMFATCLYAVLDPASGRLRKRGAQPSLRGDGGRGHGASRDRNAARRHA